MKSDDEKRIEVRAMTRERLKFRQSMYYRSGMNGLACHDCIYFSATTFSDFRDSDEGIYASDGVCRKNPPGTETDGHREAQTTWPRVNPDEDWCGEHVENEQPIPEFESVWEECYAEVFGSVKKETE